VNGVYDTKLCVFYLPKFLLLSSVFAYICILQVSVETHLPCGGIYTVSQKKACDYIFAIT